MINKDYLKNEELRKLHQENLILSQEIHSKNKELQLQKDIILKQSNELMPKNVENGDLDKEINESKWKEGLFPGEGKDPLGSNNLLNRAESFLADLHEETKEKGNKNENIMEIATSNIPNIIKGDLEIKIGNLDNLNENSEELKVSAKEEDINSMGKQKDPTINPPIDSQSKKIYLDPEVVKIEKKSNFKINDALDPSKLPGNINPISEVAKFVAGKSSTTKEYPHEGKHNSRSVKYE